MDFTQLIDLDDRALEALSDAIKQLLDSRKLTLDGKNKETSAIGRLNQLNAFVNKHNRC